MAPMSMHGRLTPAGKTHLVECQDCGAPMLDVVPQGQHGAIWRERNGQHVKVNCIGKEIPREH